jgi:hypothetical protein
MMLLKNERRSFILEKKNISENGSQELLALFEGVGNSSRIICAQIDYAKKDYVVVFCTGYD